MFTITVNAGYEIASVTVDGRAASVYVGGVLTVLTSDTHITAAEYRFGNVTANHTIHVTFKRSAKLPDYGTVIGKVSIVIENQTYSGGDFYGPILSGTYDLCERDTMMTSVLKALTLNGYTWEGTGGTSADAYDITYLSYIKQAGKKLGEFSGARGSGWMGTLNDWFVNEGFQSYRVGGSGVYSLEDGDEIHIQYTQNLGVDLGGGWGNPDTSLRSLIISGGTLSPAFTSGTVEYTLTVPDQGASIRVTPRAANKNYLVKTFLGDYNKDSAYCRRTRNIFVKPGNTLYIGVGEKGWPSMNNQGSEAMDYTGTVYKIHVTGISLQSRIDALPKADEITFKNYKDVAQTVEQLRADYEKLSAAEKAKLNITRLTEAEARIKYLNSNEAANRVNELIAAIGDSISVNSAEKIKAARAAYEKLPAEQRKLVTEYAALESAEKVLTVVNLIAAIAPVTKDNMAVEEGKITTARNAYDVLTEAERAMVSNIYHLTGQEEALKVLKGSASSLYDQQMQSVLDYIARTVPNPTLALPGANGLYWRRPERVL